LLFLFFGSVPSAPHRYLIYLNLLLEFTKTRILFMGLFH
jgi:hypothetical protein